MTLKEKMSKSLNKIPFKAIGTIFLLLIAAALLYFSSSDSRLALSPMYPLAVFEGEYRVGEGQWKEIVKGEHIPATEGTVTLRGNIVLVATDGEYLGKAEAGTPIAFFENHINLMVYEGEEEPHITDNENPAFGKAVCCEDWITYIMKSDGTEPMEIVISNPHSFGNETAIDDFLGRLSVWPGIDFERDTSAKGNTQRTIGMMFFVASVVMLGIALFSTMISIKSSTIIWIMGLVTLSAAGYYIFSAEGIVFWSENTVFNTIIQQLSLMLYMLFVLRIIKEFLVKAKKAGDITILLMGMADAVFFIVPIVTETPFFDLLPVWAILQTLANIIFAVCIVLEIMHSKNRKSRFYSAAILPLAAFQADAFATAEGFWCGGVISRYLFAVIFVVTIFVVWQVIPQRIKAAARAKELETQRSLLEAEKNAIEAELKESRIAIMLSQIQPHFIYNTLGTIERMCLKDPQKAFELVRNFSLYLRGNFSELDSVTPIRFAEEIKHIQYYVNIEHTRFPDMTVEYDLQMTDFVLPALSVQPLVENAIKHGLMQLETGGTVVISSYETPTHYCVQVKDDGGGFDTQAPIDGKKHVGLRNIRGRLKAMVNGELLVESSPGEGTKAMIMIPKERQA